MSGVAAAGAAVALTVVTYLIERRRGRPRARWLAAAAMFPFAAVAYMWIAFAGYAVWCEAIRDVDMGMGDSWRVPLAGGYALTMIDTFEQAFVRGPADQQSHHDLRRIGAGGGLIAGEDVDGRFFLIDTRQGTDRPAASEADVRQQARASGVTPFELVTPRDFYFSHRLTAADGVGAVATIGPPIVVFLALAWRFARSARPAVSEAV